MKKQGTGACRENESTRKVCVPLLQRKNPRRGRYQNTILPIKPRTDTPSPITAITIAAILNIPPLTRGDAAMSNPTAPNTPAINSANSPQPGLPEKMRTKPPIAAMIATVAAVPVLCSIAVSSPLLFEISRDQNTQRARIFNRCHTTRAAAQSTPDHGSRS